IGPFSQAGSSPRPGPRVEFILRWVLVRCKTAAPHCVRTKARKRTRSPAARLTTASTPSHLASPFPGVTVESAFLECRTPAAREVAMISFFCLNCGLKLQVKDEFAGRSSKCPTCKQPLVVPPPDKTQADVAAGPVDGTDSSLAKVGFDGGVTLQPEAR